MKTVNLADREKANKNKKPPVRSLAATLGFGKRDTSPPPAVTELRGTKTRRRSVLPKAHQAPSGEIDELYVSKSADKTIKIVVLHRTVVLFVKLSTNFNAAHEN